MAFPCPTCRYDLWAMPADALCPECGTPCPERSHYKAKRLHHARIRFRVYAALCIPAWLFVAIEAVGQFAAFVLPDLPRQHIETGQEPILDVLSKILFFVFHSLPLGAPAFLLLPFVVWDELHRPSPTRPRPARILLALLLIAPACWIVVLFTVGPMMDVWGWIPD